jgi:hypothetical protein
LFLGQKRACLWTAIAAFAAFVAVSARPRGASTTTRGSFTGSAISRPSTLASLFRRQIATTLSEILAALFVSKKKLPH